jgi:hypothetical protein
MLFSRAGLLSALLLAGFTSAASGGAVTFFMQNGNDGGDPFNTVEFRVGNISAPGVNLTGMSLTVGDAVSFNFDQIYFSVEQFSGGDGTQSATLLVGDRVQDGAVTDSFQYSFANFNPGVLFRGQWDIDFDSGAFNVDSRTVLFNNGAAPNAVASFTFSDGSSINYEFPDLPIQDTYFLTIPTPGVSMIALAGIVTATRRRR